MRARSTFRQENGSDKTTDDDDCNGKDKTQVKKFRRPPMAAFKMPPPPKIAITTPSKKNQADQQANGTVGDSEKADNSNKQQITAQPQVAEVPQMQADTSVYQRPLARNVNEQQQITSNNTTTAVNNGGVYNRDISDNSNTIYTQQQQYQPSSMQISHPYKPSSWYSDAKNVKRRRKIMQLIASVMTLLIILILLWMKRKDVQHFIQTSFKESEKKHRHYKNYHHHDHHYHPMLGINEIPTSSSNKVDASGVSNMKRSYRQLEQEHASSSDQQLVDQTTATTNDLFSTFPVTTLSNKRLLPYIGFGVSSRSVEHKQIPIIVATLLQYASSETEGGGGIALIDAVIDEDRELENNGGSLQYSITNKVAERFEDAEEKLESNLAKTVVTLVGRAISYFGKEHLKTHSMHGKAVTTHTGGYDYENRVEVHLLVGLSGPDLGIENTINALQYFMAELDGIVPSFPKDVLHTDLKSWKAPKSSPTTVDHHVDVRLHVMLRLNHCHDASQRVAACSSDVETNKELLDRFIGSYSILEKLYEGRIIHGIGLDGIHAGDIRYLINKSRIKPQLYRGDVYQALDIYGRRHGHTRMDKDEHIATVLKENDITFLASNVGGHILEMKAMTPNAFALLQNLGSVLFHAHLAQGHLALTTEGEDHYSVSRLVLSYLVRHKVCVLPHAYKAQHLADDSPEAVGGLANFLTERRVAEIGAALKALLSENDLPEDHGLGMEGEREIAVVFHNHLAGDAHIFRVMHIGNVEKEVAIAPERGGLVKASDSVVIIANHGDKFVTSAAADGDKRGTYIVKDVEKGGAIDFTIPGLSQIDEPRRHN